MNSIIRFLLLAAICAAVSANSCMAMNPLLPSLVDSGEVKAKIYDQPRINVKIEHCQAEWQQYGTCCDQDDLVLSNDLENRLIDFNVKFFAKVVREKVVNVADILTMKTGYFAKTLAAHSRDMLKEFIKLLKVVKFEKNQGNAGTSWRHSGPPPSA